LVLLLGPGGVCNLFGFVLGGHLGLVGCDFGHALCVVGSFLLHLELESLSEEVVLFDLPLVGKVLLIGDDS
jgi:hypothetical protein